MTTEQLLTQISAQLQDVVLLGMAVCALLCCVAFAVAFSAGNQR
jgi:hypothetical protein